MSRSVPGVPLPPGVPSPRRMLGRSEDLLERCERCDRCFLDSLDSVRSSSSVVWRYKALSCGFCTGCGPSISVKFSHISGKSISSIFLPLEPVRVMLLVLPWRLAAPFLLLVPRPLSRLCFRCGIRGTMGAGDGLERADRGGDGNSSGDGPSPASRSV